jgi:hypothetical protein
MPSTSVLHGAADPPNSLAQCHLWRATSGCPGVAHVCQEEDPEDHSHWVTNRAGDPCQLRCRLVIA